jgi:hypothetical protein
MRSALICELQKFARQSKRRMISRKESIKILQISQLLRYIYCGGEIVKTNLRLWSFYPIIDFSYLPYPQTNLKINLLLGRLLL